MKRVADDADVDVLTRNVEVVEIGVEGVHRTEDTAVEEIDEHLIEEEDVGENCDQNFDHCNEMNNILMPRDFLASLSNNILPSSS